MIQITINNCGGTFPPLIEVIPNKTKKDGKYFRTLEDIKFKLPTNDWVLIPKGFEFDGSSRPRFLGWALEKFGSFMLAALIHDFMYVNDTFADVLGKSEARALADDTMLFYSKKLHSENWSQRFDNYLRYYAVWLFGKYVY